jgi:hypothetical protein
MLPARQNLAEPQPKRERGHVGAAGRRIQQWGFCEGIENGLWQDGRSKSPRPATIAE